MTLWYGDVVVSSFTRARCEDTRKFAVRKVVECSVASSKRRMTVRLGTANWVWIGERSKSQGYYWIRLSVAELTGALPTPRSTYRADKRCLCRCWLLFL